MIKQRKQKGFSLIELILVLGLSSLAFISMIQWEVKKSDIAKAEIAGEQFAEVGRALSEYIAKEQVNLAYIIPRGTKKTMSIEVLKGNASDSFVPHAFLPTAFSATNIFGVNYVIQITNSAEGRIEGIVTSDNAICEKGIAVACPSAANPVKYDWIGAAMRKMGSQSAMSRLNAGVPTLYGFNAGWTATGGAAGQFDSVTQAGQIAYRVSPTDNTMFDAQYLRLDGTSTMLGNLNMGNYSIENATNISYNGWLQGFGILANTIRSGSINNTGDIQTTNMYATNVVKVGPNALPTVLTAGGPTQDGIEPGDIIADKHIYAQDIYLGTDINSPNRTRTEAGHGTNRVIPNVWLSDLLPKYSSRGIYRVDNFDVIVKPICNGANGAGVGVPKIEVIPQMTYSHGRVYGENFLVDNAQSFTNWTESIYWDLISYSPNLAWADDNGAQWTVRFETSNYNGYTMTYMTAGGTLSTYPLALPPGFTMSGLAHIYCDYSF